MPPPRFISFTDNTSPTSRDRDRRTIPTQGSLEPPAFQRSKTVPTMGSLGYDESTPGRHPGYHRSVTLNSLKAPVRPQRKKSIEYNAHDDSDYSTDGERSKSSRNLVWTARVATKHERMGGDMTPPMPTRRSSNHGTYHVSHSDSGTSSTRMPVRPKRRSSNLMDEDTYKFSPSLPLKCNSMPSKPIRRASTFTCEAA